MAESDQQLQGDERHRKIIHVDMDAFYASVEQRDNLELCGNPSDGGEVNIWFNALEKC